MKYVGLYTQQANNNIKSVLLLVFFPGIILALVYAFYVILSMMSGYQGEPLPWGYINAQFLDTVPWVVLVVGVWFIIAYLFNTAMVRQATGAREITRRENPRVYNIVENLTMACGMPMPKVNVMNTPELNAFASGIDNKSYTVTVTTGLCDRLNDEELAGVIGHELTHIRNKDTRLLIISIIFVGIMSTIMSLALRLLWNKILWGGGGSRRNNKEGNGASMVVVLVITVALAALGYLFTLLTRFAISRKREYMADAGGAELCGNPLALASALRKISGMPAAAPEGREDIAQLYIIHPQALTGGATQWLSQLFSTHPSTQSRIAYLEQF